MGQFLVIPVRVIPHVSSYVLPNVPLTPLHAPLNNAEVLQHRTGEAVHKLKAVYARTPVFTRDIHNIRSNADNYQVEV